MKLFYLILFGVGWLTTFQATAQDLIERAQLGIVLDVSRQSESVAFQESQSLKHVGPYQVVKPFDLAPDYRKSEVSAFVEGHVMLDLPGGTLPRLMNSLRDGVDLRLPVAPGKEIELDLVEVFPIHSEFEGHTSEGETITLAKYPARFYRGAVKGVPNSFASITIAPGMFRGLIGDDYGNYVLAELDNTDDRFVLYNDKKLKIQNDFECGVEDTPFSDEDQALLQQTDRVVNADRSSDCVDIMVEMEEDFWDDWGNTTNATNFIYALMNEGATLYNNENISCTLKDIIMWTTVDPYTETGACDQRTQFGNIRQNNYNGRLAHLISSRAIGGGCAYIDELCSNYSLNNGPYQFSGSMSTSVVAFPTYSWNVMVFVHEMGHTWGSRHTHACVWNGNNTAIDGCSGSTEGTCALPGIPPGGGTMMSYCHLQGVGINFNLGFGPQPGDVIRDRTYNSSCGLDCGNITACPREIYLDGDVESDTYYADRKVEMSGTVLSGRTVNLRCDIGSHIWNPGFRVNNGGVLSSDQAACTAALDGGGNNEVIKTTVDPDLTDQIQSTLNK